MAAIGSAADVVDELHDLDCHLSLVWKHFHAVNPNNFRDRFYLYHFINSNEKIVLSHLSNEDAYCPLDEERYAMVFGGF